MLRRFYVPSNSAARRLSSTVLRRPNRCRPQRTLLTRGYDVPPRSRLKLSPPYQPLKAGIRWRDFVLGVAFTLVLDFALSNFPGYWHRREIERAIQEAQLNEEDQALGIEFAAKFAEARRTNDQESLKELTFEFQRRSATLDNARPDATYRTEWMPFPNYAEGDAWYGKERIPQDDTLMFVTTDTEGKVVLVLIAINAEIEDVLGPKPMTPFSVQFPEDSKLFELFGRIDCQKLAWHKENKIRDEPLRLGVVARDRLALFISTRPGQYIGPLGRSDLERS